MARDYRAEIAEAAKAGDIHRLAFIAHNLLGRIEEDDDRRARAAEKKRKQREGKLSGTSETSPNVPGRPGTNGDVPPVVTAQRSTTNAPHPARQVIAKLGDMKLQSALDRLLALSGDHWADVAEFFLRRKYSSWQGWADSMLRDVGMASQFTPADLARVCQDDATLERPIGSAYGLRKFLGPVRQERLDAMQPPNERGPPTTTNGRRPPARVMPGAQQFPAASDPDAEVKWTP